MLWGQALTLGLLSAAQERRGPCLSRVVDALLHGGVEGERGAALLPSRAVRAGGAPGVVLETGEDGVADLPLQRAQGFFAGLAFGHFLVVVGAAGAVLVADLGDRGQVDGVVDPAVAAPGRGACD